MRVITYVWSQKPSTLLFCGIRCVSLASDWNLECWNAQGIPNCCSFPFLELRYGILSSGPALHTHSISLQSPALYIGYLFGAVTLGGISFRSFFPSNEDSTSLHFMTTRQQVGWFLHGLWQVSCQGVAWRICCYQTEAKSPGTRWKWCSGAEMASKKL